MAILQNHHKLYNIPCSLEGGSSVGPRDREVTVRVRMAARGQVLAVASVEWQRGTGTLRDRYEVAPSAVNIKNYLRLSLFRSARCDARVGPGIAPARTLAALLQSL